MTEIKNADRNYMKCTPKVVSNFWGHIKPEGFFISPESFFAVEQSGVIGGDIDRFIKNDVAESVSFLFVVILISDALRLFFEFCLVKILLKTLFLVERYRLAVAVAAENVDLTLILDVIRVAGYPLPGVFLQQYDIVIELAVELV